MQALQRRGPIYFKMENDMKRYLALFMLVLIGGMASTPEVHVPNGVLYSEPTEVEKFMQHMARRESNNTHTVVNPYGMMGKYQFSPSTVRVLGFRVEKDQFLNDHRLQDSVMLAYMRANNRELSTIIRRYEGKTYKGVHITRAGVIAAAHLVGSGNVRLYFNNDDPQGRTDANGTSLRDYLQEFNKYNIGESF